MAAARRKWLQALFVLACGVSMPLRAAPDPVLRITLLDGSATVLDGAARAAAVLGLPLASGSIVETDAKSRLLRIESADGQALDLGPDTRVMLDPPGFARRGKPSPGLYLLQGWLKISAVQAPGTLAVITRDFELPTFEGVAVTRVATDHAWVFVESGRITLVERGRRDSAPLAAERGAFYERGAQAEAVLTARATTAQLQRVPRLFRDPLPLRYAAVSTLEVTAQPLPDPSYADLQPWLSAERALRGGFTRRFSPLLRDREFRRALDAHLRDHTEWRPILHPPPTPPPPSAAKPG
jgi:hypothetical protein